MRVYASDQQSNAPNTQAKSISLCIRCVYFSEEAGMTRLCKWGNSSGGLRLGQAVLDAAGLRVGDDLSVRLLDNGSILLTPRKGPVAVEGNQVVQRVPKKPPARAPMLDKW